MKKIEPGIYKRYIGNDRWMTLEVLQKTYDENPPAWQRDERIQAITKWERKSGTLLYRIGQNEPFSTDFYQVRYEELPEEEWYEYFTAGMSDIHPNDRLKD